VFASLRWCIISVLFRILIGAEMSERRIVIMGAAGRDFHDFLVRYRDDESVQVVAFTATQIPGIDSRTFPAELAGPRYPDGIRIVPKATSSTSSLRRRSMRWSSPTAT